MEDKVSSPSDTGLEDGEGSMDCQYVVVISCGDDQTKEIESLLELEIQNLQLVLSPQLLNRIFNDMCRNCGSRSAMIGKYVALLRKTYPRTDSDPNEIDIMRFASYSGC